MGFCQVPAIELVSHQTLCTISSATSARVCQHQLKHLLTRTTGNLHPRHRTHNPMARDGSFAERKNTMHTLASAVGRPHIDPSICSSSTASVQQAIAMPQSCLLGHDQQSQSQMMSAPQGRSGVPVYVMLPLDTVSPCNSEDLASA